VIVDLQSDLRRTVGHFASAGILEPAARATSNRLSRHTTPSFIAVRPSAQSRAAARQLWFRVSAQRPKPKLLPFNGLRTLVLSLRSFSDRPSFVFNHFRTLLQNTGGVGASENLSFRITNLPTIFPRSVGNLVTQPRAESPRPSSPQRKSFRIRSYEKRLPKSFRMRSYRQPGGGAPSVVRAIGGNTKAPATVRGRYR
jgi:hypothetical protein